MSAPSLEADLRALGHPCQVEARDRLAVIIPSGGLAVALSWALRDDALRLAPLHNFTHVALEIPGVGERDATLPRY